MDATQLPPWLEVATRALASGDLEGWMAIYADDAVHEFPFADDGAVGRLVGRSEIEPYMASLPGFVRFGQIEATRVIENGADLVVEAVGHHRRVSDDVPVDLAYVWIITLRDGKVAHIRDYMSPVQLAAFA